MERWTIKKFLERKLKYFSFLAGAISLIFYPRFIRNILKKVYVNFLKDGEKEKSKFINMY